MLAGENDGLQKYSETVRIHLCSIKNVSLHCCCMYCMLLNRRNQKADKLNNGNC